MPNHHTLYGKTQNKIQSLISPLVLFRNIPQSLGLLMPQTGVEVQRGTCPKTDLLSGGFPQQGPEKGWLGHRLYLMEQLCVDANLMTQVGDYLLPASLN